MIKDPDFEKNIPNTQTTDEKLYTFRDSDNNEMAQIWWGVENYGIYLVALQSGLHPAITAFVARGSPLFPLPFPLWAFS